MIISQLQFPWPPLITAAFAVGILSIARRAFAVKIHFLALFLGGLLMAVVPIHYALAHKLAWKFLGLIELTQAAVPDVAIIGNLYQLAPQVMFISTVFSAGFVTGCFAKSSPILYATVLSLLYPLAITVSCASISLFAGWRIEPYQFLGGPSMPLVLVVLSLSIVGAVFSRGIRTAAIFLSLNIFYTVFFVVINPLLESRLQRLSIESAEQSLESKLLAYPWEQKFLMVERRQPSKGPFRYTGLHNFNGIGVWGHVKRCEDDAAVLGAFDGSYDKFPTADRLVVRVDCALMPDTDILIDKHHYADLRCPSGYVATSGTGVTCPRQECDDILTSQVSQRLNQHCSNCPQQIRCTKVNDDRYQLGPEHPGIFWGTRSSRWREKLTTQKAELPKAVRYGLGRFNYRTTTSHGCIGNPIGSILVAKTGTMCHQYFFRQLQYRGIPGDPPQGTPVPIFRDCIDAGDNDSRLDCEVR